MTQASCMYQIVMSESINRTHNQAFFLQREKRKKIEFVSLHIIFILRERKIVDRLYQYDYENITKIDEHNCNAIKWNLFAEIKN